nr:hypothetical protein [Pandoravirus belohorizontensis]
MAVCSFFFLGDHFFLLFFSLWVRKGATCALRGGAWRGLFLAVRGSCRFGAAAPRCHTRRAWTTKASPCLSSAEERDGVAWRARPPLCPGRSICFPFAIFSLFLSTPAHWNPWLGALSGTRATARLLAHPFFLLRVVARVTRAVGLDRPKPAAALSSFFA